MVIRMPRRPSRIDLLELDIDVRLADLWREANDISEWSLEVVGAFMRAAYGKGYCDALTEDATARSASSTATACRNGGRSRPCLQLNRRTSPSSRKSAYAMSG